MKFNINHKVRVKLTQRGRELIAENHRNLFGSRAHMFPMRDIKEHDGWSEWQLWDLMSEFGPHMWNGCSVPFETEIEILEEPEEASAPSNGER